MESGCRVATPPCGYTDGPDKNEDMSNETWEREVAVECPQCGYKGTEIFEEGMGYIIWKCPVCHEEDPYDTL